MIAVIDIGNTRLKWAIADEHGLSQADSTIHVDGLEAAVDALVEALPRGVRRALAVNVAGRAVGARIAGALGARACATTFVAAEAERFGIRIAYAEPASLGADRWVAMLAAHESTPGAVCVIQAGTAVTFDALDASGQHLGGLILPSPRLMADSLRRNTARIGPAWFDAPRAPGLGVLGASTREAVARGAMLAIGAALDRAVAVVRAETEPAAQVLMTGGDAERLRPWLETDVLFSADLVLAGLAYMARHGE